MNNRQLASVVAHLYTAFGTVLGFFALAHVSRGEYARGFLIIMLAYMVDYTDGTLARFVRVREAFPIIDGATLDHIVDFVTSVVAPAFLLWRVGLLPSPQLLWVSLMFFASLARFSKTLNPWLKKGFFLGLPTPWIYLTFYLYFLRPGPIVSGLLILLLVSLTFFPLGYIHIARFPRIRWFSVTILGLWWLIYLVVTQQWVVRSSGFIYFSMIPLFTYLALSWYFSVRHSFTLSGLAKSHDWREGRAASSSVGGEV